jgi:biotin synthase
MNNCRYCGIRAGNSAVQRYRLSPGQIIDCCRKGYSLGFRTFVLQSGEDSFYTDDMICKMISEIKNACPGCAVTLSIGEKSHESYRRYFSAGADRYLLRHETADPEHYTALHPETMSLQNRKDCLLALKETGFQTGSGFIIGSPFQKTGHIIADIRFLQELQPEMIGVGPFISHPETPFANFPDGSISLTLRITAILRLIFPDALIPATTALATLAEDGRERGIRAGANVIMPNLSPMDCRKKYEIYQNKLFSGEESAEEIEKLRKKISLTGCSISMERGDHKQAGSKK